MAISLAQAAPIALPNPVAIQADISAWRAAYPQLDSHLALGVEPVKALRHLGLSAWASGEPKFATTVLINAAALAPDDAALWADLSGAYSACAQPEEARACLLASIERRDDVPARWLTLASLYRDAQRDEEAEEAFSKALELNPVLHDAWVGLGIMYFQHRRLPQAVAALRRAIRFGSTNVAVHACLGEALYLQGEIAGAAELYGKQVEITPNESGIVQKYAFMRFLDALIQGSVDEALIVYRDAAGAQALEEQTIIQNAFHALSGYGYREAAARCGRARLAHAPDDSVMTYLMAALEGTPLTRAPDNYIKPTFDQFSESFDHKLVNVLDYRVPEKIRRELAAIGGSFAKVLDAGCGTGLAGPLLQEPGRVLTGLDLSPRMLAKASERGVYDRLVEGEIHEFLLSAQERFDLVFAADVLVYIGDLGVLIERVAGVLDSGGVFAFSVETTEAADYVLAASGRFAHRPVYVERAARAFFDVERTLATQIRLDAKGPAQGMIFILRKREAAPSS